MYGFILFTLCKMQLYLEAEILVRGSELGSFQTLIQLCLFLDYVEFVFIKGQNHEKNSYDSWFHVLKSKMFSLEVWRLRPCSLDVLYGGLGISKLQFFIQKYQHFFPVNFFQFLVTKAYLRIRISIQPKMLDPDPESMNPDPKLLKRYL